MFGFPCFWTGKCGFKRDSKVKALDTVSIGKYDYEDVGLAFDETARHSILNEHKRSILYELKMSENDAKQYDLQHDLLSPHYEILTRDGCTLCPHAKAKERELWFQQYPEAVPIVLELQELVKRERPDQTPLRDYKWFIEEDGTIN